MRKNTVCESFKEMKTNTVDHCRIHLHKVIEMSMSGNSKD